MPIDQTGNGLEHNSPRGRRFGSAARRSTRVPLFRLAYDLFRALEQGELVLFFQPEIEIATGRIVSVEALVRWEHPQRGLLEPSAFVRLAEESGAINEIGAWVLVEATNQLMQWRSSETCPAEMTMSVNLSPRQLMTPVFVDVVEGVLTHSDLPPNRLCLEITESTVVQNIELCAEMLTELKSLGVILGLDDFGTGQSTLASLGSYPVDLLKIDRSFMSRASTSVKGQRLFAAAVAIAHSLDLLAVAEGIETAEQLEFAGTVGCDIAQGFYISEPVPTEVMSRLLVEGSLA